MAAASWVRSAAGDVCLADQAVGLSRDPFRSRGGVFGFAADELTGALHAPDHGPEIGLQQVDGLKNIANPRGWRRSRCTLKCGSHGIARRRRLNAFYALPKQAWGDGPGSVVMVNIWLSKWPRQDFRGRGRAALICRGNIEVHPDRHMVRGLLPGAHMAVDADLGQAVGRLRRQ